MEKYKPLVVAALKNRNTECCQEEQRQEIIMPEAQANNGDTTPLNSSQIVS